MSEPGPSARRPYRVGYAPGAYDLFHIGHLNILRHARSRCDYLVAGVVSDEMAELAKGRRPMIPLVERLEIVRSVKYVDAAFVETVPDKVETWKQVRFDVIFKGDDWRGTPKGDRLEKDFAPHGVDVVYFPYTVHTSSTQLRRALDALAQPLAGPEALTAERR
ncbi:adenylyltransferase/cytidyltransferase family protein [Streptomyces sp. DK15]|uniref:adenylyltransferase/cytidyltransferase family protein n=1 Tax=Streptomyces sp. DK15 TaxID=2957499 RepID=UPI0029BA4386|nr:adenylyltransferase/cytidyltransferase family protein [Streptomyces sp. DK15]MDX2392151.1 adenylyltransferase/cytidyltransferase family protein [Streptomyces sp. DK15]